MTNRVRHIQFKGTRQTRDTALQLLRDAGDVVIIDRGRPRFAVIRCPCGCGENLFANLDSRAGPAWRLYQKQKKLTLFPSYWREDACESHFILWNDRIFWCDFRGGEGDFWSIDPSVEQLVLQSLPDDHFIKYTAVADTLGLIPWEVLQACRQLESRGLAIGEKDFRDAAFRRLPYSAPQPTWTSRILRIFRLTS
ncbi:MAG: DUF6527 family protein [Chthoniobacterales bacterium]